MKTAELNKLIRRIVKEEKRASTKKRLTEDTYGEEAPGTLTFKYVNFEITDSPGEGFVGGLAEYKCTDISGLTLFIDLGASGTVSHGEVVEVTGVGDYIEGTAFSVHYANGQKFRSELK